MNDTNPSEKHCFKKRVFYTRAHAKAELKKVRRDLRDNDLEIYHCYTFDHWHIGHKWRTA